MTAKGKGMRILLIGLMLVMAGCATIPPLQTATGKPEITILNSTKKEIINYLTNKMINKNYEIKKINDYVAVYGKPSESESLNFLYGTDQYRTPEYRVSFNFVDKEAKIRIIAMLQVVSNPGSAFEKIHNIGGVNAHDYQQMLEKMKIDLSKISPPSER